jgi:predicted RNA-binding Zn-ribbon protein involved in translation (DUF1610 family)
MTHIYDWDIAPETIAIRCPKCGSEAVFRSPFTVLTYLPQGSRWVRLARGYPSSQVPPEEALIDLAMMYPETHIENWLGSYVLVHFPTIFPWTPPAAKQPYEPEREWGVSSCPNCGYQGKHRLSWPDDAYYVTDFKGHALWAWSRGHAQALKTFVESKDRNPRDYPGYFLFLLHIPEVFLLAKNRDAVTKRLKRMLES